MTRPFALLGSAAIAVLATAACASSSPYAASSSPSSDPYAAAPSAAASPVAVSPASTGTLIQVGNSRLGQILIDSKGRTVYLFLADSGAVSTCNSAACVQYWPPVLTAGAPIAGAGVNAALLGTAARKDGTTQVRYAGHPLYYFITDQKAGDVTGQGINGFGGPWYVVSPSGTQIG
jgi:predicted lipoprotein with Yx(FWY)xxD motif